MYSKTRDAWVGGITNVGIKIKTIMSVALGVTDFVHAVGEVEMLVSNEKNIPMENQNNQCLLKILEVSSGKNTTTTTAVAAGKLVTYLDKYYPTH